MILYIFKRINYAAAQWLYRIIFHCTTFFLRINIYLDVQYPPLYCAYVATGGDGGSIVVENVLKYIALTKVGKTRYNYILYNCST